MEKYRDLPMDLADAALVRVAERESLTEIFTLHKRHFSIYRAGRRRRFTVDDDVAKVSLVGAGMKSHPGVAADMFDVLASEAINIEMISTSPIRVSCMIRRADGERAVRAIHTRFGLDVPA